MPIYEYECMQCGQVEETFQKFSDKPLTKCRHCSGKLHKLMSRSSFHLKGTGWYVTDYKDRSKKTASDTPTGGTDSSSKSDKDSSSKSDKKASAAETKPTEKKSEKAAD